MKLDHIVVVGLGYVGLPLALALARSFRVTGLDIDTGRVKELLRGHDRTGEVTALDLGGSSIRLTAAPELCSGADVYIVTVPTPVDDQNQPDMRPIISATRTVAQLIQTGTPSVVVYESTVYPGVTEEVCGPLLEQEGRLVRGRDFWLGYSPERINPGDREHTVDRITKVVAAENPEVLALLSDIYGAVTTGGVFPARTIKVAEAAKVIENAQRDINIAFMNEIASIFADIDVSIWDVLDAARTKWNFLPFEPGLVGGHCIGVDPYYLAHLAQMNGRVPRVILAGRETNDRMGAWIADRLTDTVGRGRRILVLGITFKEDVPDIRNSKVIDLVRALVAAGHEVHVQDAVADPAEVEAEYGISLLSAPPSGNYDVVIGAVPHRCYRDLTAQELVAFVRPDGLVADIKGMWRNLLLADTIRRWTL